MIQNYSHEQTLKFSQERLGFSNPLSCHGGSAHKPGHHDDEDSCNSSKGTHASQRLTHSKNFFFEQTFDQEPKSCYSRGPSEDIFCVDVPAQHESQNVSTAFPQSHHGKRDATSDFNTSISRTDSEVQKMNPETNNSKIGDLTLHGAHLKNPNIAKLRIPSQQLSSRRRSAPALSLSCTKSQNFDFQNTDRSESVTTVAQQPQSPKILQIPDSFFCRLKNANFNFDIMRGEMKNDSMGCGGYFMKRASCVPSFSEESSSKEEGSEKKESKECPFSFNVILSKCLEKRNEIRNKRKNCGKFARFGARLCERFGEKKDVGCEEKVEKNEK